MSQVAKEEEAEEETKRWRRRSNSRQGKCCYVVSVFAWLTYVASAVAAAATTTTTSTTLRTPTPTPASAPLHCLVLSLITDNNELPSFVVAAKWRRLWIRISN